MNWSNEKILKIAMEQSAFDANCSAEYFLPDLNVLADRPCDFELKLLKPEDFANLYLPEWSNALCEKRKHLDILCVGAFDGKKLVGLAGCSADCDSMWQIGIDVLPEYRQKGIASALADWLLKLWRGEKFRFIVVRGQI